MEKLVQQGLAETYEQEVLRTPLKEETIPVEPPQAVAGRNEHGQGIEPGAEGVFPQPAQQIRSQGACGAFYFGSCRN